MTETITDKTQALAAVKINGWALGDVSDELKADKEVVLVAVETNSGAFLHASDELKADKEVVAAVGEENTLEHESDELKAKQNNRLVMEVNGRGGDFYYHRLPINEYKKLKDTSLNWLTEKYGDEALSKDSEVMLDISMAEVTITLNGQTLISEQELIKLAKPKIEDSQKFWRDFAGRGSAIAAA